MVEMEGEEAAVTVGDGSLTAAVTTFSKSKLKRMEKKAKKLITEFQLAKSNDAIKRPGELLDFPPELKRIRELGRAESESQNPERKKLSPEDFKDLKARLRERKKLLTALPRFSLQAAGLSAALSMAHDIRVPILVSDVQQLILYALGGNTVCHPPERWCYMEKYTNLTHIVVLILEGLSCHDFLTYEHLMSKVTAIFPERVEVMSPCQYGTDVAQEMACVALSQAQKQNILQKYGTLEAALHSKEVFKVFRAIFPINFSQTEAEEEDELSICSSAPPPRLLLPPSDVFPRTLLLLSLQQMVLENYPLPFEAEMTEKYALYKMSRRKYREVSNASPLFAVDCEMCLTENNLSELTHIAVVNEAHEVVYESLVKPKTKITNYLTEFSGITKKLLENVSTTLEDVQRALRRVLPRDAILVGHSLNCDLHAIKLIHPYVIDTSVIFNVSGQRHRKPKLALLVESFLGETIQSEEKGHCPIEDATATMKLVQLKLASGFGFGDAMVGEAEPGSGFRECQLSSSIFNQTAKVEKTVAVIAQDSILEKYKNFSMGSSPGSFVPISIRKSKEAIEQVQAVAVNNNLTLAHLDLTSKVKGQKMEKVMSTVDEMVQNVFSHVSKNGLFLTLFTGPNTPPPTPTPPPSESGDSDITTTNGDTATTHPRNGDMAAATNGDNTSAAATNGDSDTSVHNPISHESSTSRTRQNGACFIRINTHK